MGVNSDVVKEATPQLTQERRKHFALREFQNIFFVQQLIVLFYKKFTALVLLTMGIFSCVCTLYG